MADLKVIITDERGLKTETSVSSGAPIIESKSSTSVVKSTAIPSSDTSSGLKTAGAIAAGVMLANTAKNMTVNHIQYQTSGRSSNKRAFETVSEIANVGMIAYSNPYMAAAVVGIKIANEAIDHNRTMRIDKREQRQSLAKAGYSSQNEMLGRRR